MQTKRRLYLFLVSFSIAALVVVSIFGENTEAKDNFTIKITHVLSAKHHYTAGANKFKEIIEAQSNGRIKVDVYPNAQLGGERAVLEGLQMGSIEMGIITSGALSGFVPEFAILDLGYLFRDNDEAMKILNGPVGKKLSKRMVEVGIRNLGFINFAFRSVYCNKPVTKLTNLEGLKIRTMENPAHQALFRALGASPVPMAWPELYTGLQQGTIDAAENSPDVLWASKQYEVAKQYSLTEHVFNVVMYMISERFHKTLPSDLQQMVASAAKEALEFENGIIKRDIKNALVKLKEAGVVVHEVKNKKPFMDAAKKSWDEMLTKIPNGQEYLKEILKQEGRSK
jgi:tripartite ATP-independent transporter DctP family solute receptor